MNPEKGKAHEAGGSEVGSESKVNVIAFDINHEAVRAGEIAVAQDPSSDVTHVTVFTSADRPIGKRITRGTDGALVKTALGTIVKGTANRSSVASLTEFMQLRESLAPNQALAYGVLPSATAHIVTLKARAAGAVGSARSRGDMRWSLGSGIVCLDHDPNGRPCTPEDLYKRVIRSVPGLVGVTMAWAPSGSSCIYDSDSGAELAGVAGQRLYFVVDRADDVPRIVKIIRDRLVLAGHGYALITKAGTVYVRTSVDPSVAAPEHLDFTTATCGPGLVRRQTPWGWFPVDTTADLGLEVAAVSADIPDLTEAERGRLRETEQAIKEDPITVAAARDARAAWAAERARAAKPNADPAEHEHLAAAISAKCDQQALHDDDTLLLQDGRAVTVREVLAHPDNYNGMRCADPLEPGEDTRIALILTRRTNGGKPAIRSHAHGGYWLSLGDSLTGFEDVASTVHDLGEQTEDRRHHQRAANSLLQLDEPLDATPPNMTLAAMLHDCVYVAAGGLVGLKSAPRHSLPFNEFKGLTAALVEHRTSSDGRTRAVPRAEAWKANSLRQTVHTQTFRAGAPRICFDPDGLPSLNTWTPFARGEAKRDPHPFIEQIEYLFSDGDDCDAFLDFLAHIEQRPGELPHFGWLHIAAHHGAGRNWVASVLSRVWRGQVAPNVELNELMESSFNGGIAGRVLAIVDECQVPAGENPHKHANKLKSMVNVETRSVNPKYGKAYLEHNACRWLCFSNFDNALPIDKHDRRFRVARHTALPRPSATYAHLYGLMNDPEFINAVAVYLGHRDIGMFKPGERPPLSAAKLMAIAATKTMLEQHAEELVEHWPADVATNPDIAEFLTGTLGSPFTPAMRRVLENLGCVAMPRVVKIDGIARRCWAVRKTNKWAAAEPSTIAIEVVKAKRDQWASALDVLSRDPVTELQQLRRI